MLGNIGLINFIRNLPKTHRLAVLASGGIGFATAALDAVALALVVPTVEFMVGFSESAMGSEAAGWFRFIFDLVGAPFTLTSTLVFVLTVAVVRSSFILLQSTADAFFRARFEAHLRSRLYSAIMTAEWPFLLRQRAGALQNALMVECQRAAGALAMLLAGVSALLGIGIYVVVAFKVSWHLALIAVAGTGALQLAFRFLTHLARRLGVAATEANTALASEVTEGLSGAKILKSHAQEAAAVRHFDGVVAERARIETLTGVNRGVFASLAELSFVVLLLGGLFAATRVMDIEASTVLLFTLLFIRMFQRGRSLQGTVMLFSNLMPSMDVVDRFTRRATARVERDSGGAVPSLQVGIEFKRVSFSYDARTRILDSVDLLVPAGSTVALAGSSGGGKTTIIDLTIGLLTPDEGEITVDGRPLSSLDLRAWRSKVAYVSQDTILFHDTIAANIARGRTGTSDAQIRRRQNSLRRTVLSEPRRTGMRR